MSKNFTFAYTSLVKDKRFNQFLRDSLRLVQWKARQSRLNPAPGKPTGKKHNPGVVVSLGDSDYVIIR